MKKSIIALLSIYLLFTYSSCTVQANSSGIKENKTPKNIIFLIGDGMGIGQMEIARLFQYGKEGSLYMESLPYTALAHTYSESHRVTDSAAGGTALAIGKKTTNGMIGITSDGQVKDSILDISKKNGKRTAIITTNSVTDATPASFSASVNNRWADQEEIAKQQLENSVDIILGGGYKNFRKKDKRGLTLLDAYKKQGYEVVTTKEELLKSNHTQLLGLFNESHLNFQLDKEELTSNEPSLKEMTQKSLEILSSDDKGFFAMIEGGRIDHASHSSDITGIWKETVAFDEVVKECVEWAKKRDDTLVIVAADHETMGLSATEAMDIEGLKEIKVSPYYMVSQLQKNKNGVGYTNKSIKNVFKKYAHIELSDTEAKKFQQHVHPLKDQVYPDQHVAWNIGSMIANHYHAGVTNRTAQKLSSTGGHTSNMIAVFAYGNGADQFHGVIDNTDIPKKIASIMGYSF